MATVAEGYDGPSIKGYWISDHCLKVVLNRAKVNAFDTALRLELGAIFKKIKFDPNVWSVVLCSGVKVFTAGLDLLAPELSEVRGEDAARSAFLMRDHVLEFQDCISWIQDCDRPVVVAIHGICYGLGIDIISACDIRLCTSTTRFSIKEVDAGLAADIGTLQRLPKATGNDSLLRDLAFTAREFGPQEAVELGMIAKGHVVDGGAEQVIARAEELGKIIGSKSPIATRGTKHLLNHARDHSVREGLEYSALWNAAALQAEDVPLAMTAVMSKGSPTFKTISKL